MTSEILVDLNAAAPQTPARSIAVVLLFAATMFLSAFLLFVAQPIVAKTVLPTLGGAPMVWNTCVVFFQVVLLAGYAYAHVASTWLGPRRYAVVHAVLLTLPLLVLPFSTQVGTPPPDAMPIGWLLLQLLALIGLPFLVLSTTTVVVQSWFSTTHYRVARDPYFLFAASNMGSLLGLIAYPIVVEPMLRLREQSRIWSLVYAVFVLATSMCAVVVWRNGASVEEKRRAMADQGAESADRTAPVSALRRARWIALSFIPSSMMLAVTSYFSTDIAAVPLLWIVPLSLYLLTLVLAFGSRSQATSVIADRGLPLLVIPIALLMIAQAQMALWLLVPLHLAAFALVSLFHHSELARDRPPPSSLTEFYFWLAFGGMLGAMFNTLAAPLLFKGVVEYPLILVLACLFRKGAGTEAERPSLRSLDVIAPLAVGLLTAGLLAIARSFGNDPQVIAAVLAPPAFVSFSQSRRPIRFALCLGVMLLAGSLGSDVRGRTVHIERTFFGVYRVSIDASGSYRSLFHGTTLHGMQAIDPARRHEPLSYYHRTGPFGQAFSQLPNVTQASDIAVVGLGIGSLASYVMPGQRWTFYELDRAVERMARTTEYFTYLRDCGDQCGVVLGDARVSLADARPNQYGLIVIDAFSSDAVPLHLLTREAFTLYLSRLAPRGVLALHISNRHLSLGSVITRLAQVHGLIAIEQQELVADEASSGGKRSSDWVVMAANAADLGPLPADARWKIPVVSASTPLWTDDSSSILSVLRYR